MIHGLKIYKWVADEDDDSITMDFNSLVDSPAHMKPFVTFGDHAKRTYAVGSEEERIVFGALISVGTPIYRNDNGYEYYGIFDKPTTTKIKEKMMRQGFMHNLNTDHNSDKVVKGAFLTEIFQIDSKRGTHCPDCLKGQNLQDGSLIGAYKITDDKVWSDIKEGKFRGFSIEAYLDVKPANVKKANMSKQRTSLFRMPNFFSDTTEEEEVKTFAEATTSDGTILRYEGELGSGTPVFIEVDGENMPAPEGEHEVTLSDGSVKLIVVDANGVVSSIEDVAEMSEEGEAILAAVEQTMSRKMSALTKKFDDLKKENESLKSEVEALKAERKGSKFNDEKKANTTGGGATWKTLKK